MENQAFRPVSVFAEQVRRIVGKWEEVSVVELRPELGLRHPAQMRAAVLPKIAPGKLLRAVGWAPHFPKGGTIGSQFYQGGMWSQFCNSAMVTLLQRIRIWQSTQGCVTQGSPCPRMAAGHSTPATRTWDFTTTFPSLGWQSTISYSVIRNCLAFNSLSSVISFSVEILLQEQGAWNFPGGLGVRIPSWHCCDLGSIPAWGIEILQAA